MRILNVDMRERTTIHIGGIARIYEIEDYHEIYGLEGVPIGNCSNILVSDHISTPLISLRRLDNVDIFGTHIVAEAGVKLSRLVYDARDRGLKGLEYMVGIPASVGGAICTNAGAYGGEIGDIVEGVDLYRDGREIHLSHEDLDFGYRHSSIQPHDIITRIYMSLTRGDTRTISADMCRYICKRRATQPTGYTMGSVFKRVDGVSAGYYIDQCGLKGYHIGDAEISPIHAGFIVNLGHATFSETRDLIEYTRDTVIREQGITLQEEIRYIL